MLTRPIPLLQHLPAVGFRPSPPLLSAPLLRCSFLPPEPLVSFAPSQTMPCARRGTGDAPGLAGEGEAWEREGRRCAHLDGEGGNEWVTHGPPHAYVAVNASVALSKPLNIGQNSLSLAQVLNGFNS